jgi:phage head maturation protease
MRIDYHKIWDTKSSKFEEFADIDSAFQWLEKHQGEDVIVYGDVFITKAENGDMVMSDATMDDDEERMDPQGWLLDRYKTNPILLWGHDQSRPAIGIMENVRVEGGALRGVPKFDTADGEDKLALIVQKKFENGTLRAGSVGFRPLKVEQKGNAKTGKMELWITQQELGEFSIVNLPNNRSAIRSQTQGAGADAHTKASNGPRIQLNTSAVAHCKSLIAAGKVDRGDTWEAPSGKERDPELCLAEDTKAAKDAAGRYKYPVGKGGKVYRKGVIAAESRASQQGLSDVAARAKDLLRLIDKDKEGKASDAFETKASDDFNNLFTAQIALDTLLPKVETKASHQTSDLETLFASLSLESMFETKSPSIVSVTHTAMAAMSNEDGVDAGLPIGQENLPEDALYEWLINDDAQTHCDDCEEREGQVHTMDEWVDLGLPGDEGSTACGEHCKCSISLIQK